MILYTALSNMFQVQGNFHLTIYWNMYKYWWILNRPIAVIISQYIYIYMESCYAPGNNTMLKVLNISYI